MFKKYRLKKGLTQEQLAELMNLSTRQIQRLESNENLPSLKTLKQLVKLLNISDKDIASYIKNDI